MLNLFKYRKIFLTLFLESWPKTITRLKKLNVTNPKIFLKNKDPEYGVGH